MSSRWAAATLVVAALFFVACYSPSIAGGGFRCGADGGCPDNFHCNASNNRCYQEADAHIDRPPVCTSVTKAPKTCDTAPPNGQACNPICQNGCDGCGWCGVSNGAMKCLTGTAGTKDLGALCDPSLATECKVGLYCQPDCGKGRCYQLCDPTVLNSCGTGQGAMCSVAGISHGDAGTISFSLCRLVTPTCDPVGQTGCVDPAFACYPTSPTECDCHGSVAIGAACQLAAQCGPGASCIGLTSTKSVCLRTCKSSSDCTAPATCNNASPYGYCM